MTEHGNFSDSLSGGYSPFLLATQDNTMAKEGVLVVGGCGLVGFHVVKALLDDGIWPSVQRHESVETPHAINLLVRLIMLET